MAQGPTQKCVVTTRKKVWKDLLIYFGGLFMQASSFTSFLVGHWWNKKMSMTEKKRWQTSLWGESEKGTLWKRERNIEKRPMKIINLFVLETNECDDEAGPKGWEESGSKCLWEGWEASIRPSLKVIYNIVLCKDMWLCYHRAFLFAVCPECEIELRSWSFDFNYLCIVQPCIFQILCTSEWAKPLHKISIGSTVLEITQRRTKLVSLWGSKPVW